MGAWKRANPSEKLRIYSWNVNGIKSTLKKNDLQSFFKDAAPDIVCLNETKTDADQIGKLKLWQEIPDGYE